MYRRLIWMGMSKDLINPAKPEVDPVVIGLGATRILISTISKTITLPLYHIDTTPAFQTQPWQPNLPPYPNRFVEHSSQQYRCRGRRSLPKVEASQPVSDYHHILQYGTNRSLSHRNAYDSKLVATSVALGLDEPRTVMVKRSIALAYV